jgi:predicted nucleotidyltransferase
MGLKLDLEELFGRRVDLLTPKSLSPTMRDEIHEEAIVAP